MSYHDLGTDYDRRGPGDPSQYPACATQAQHDAAHAACKPLVLRGLGLLDLSTNNPCWVETLPICPPTRPPTLRAAVPRRAPAPAVDWAAVARYAAAVKAANEKRSADLIAYAQAVRDAKAKADLLAYVAAVKAQADLRAAQLVAYALAVKARAALPPAVQATTPPPAPPKAPPPPAKPRALTAPPPGAPPPPKQSPPPAPPPSAPPEVTAPSEEDEPPPVAQAGFGTGGLLAIVAVVAVGGWLVFGRKKKAA
jgi:hypothetical protein